MIKRAKISVSDEEVKAVSEVVKSGRYVKGPNVKGFEEEFSKFIGTKYGVALNSGTSALIVALEAAGIGPGDEVITSTHTFTATGNSILISGAKPVLVDIEPETFNINPELVKKAVTDKTKAIMPVHLYGQSADMAPINELAKEKDLIVIEDAAQAHGAKYKDKNCGSLGDIGCFSFYPTKNMTVCGDGGMVMTDNEEFYDRAVMLRDAGRKPGDVDTSYLAGQNFRLSEMQASVGRIQLKKVSGWNEERRKIASWYDEKLPDSIVKPVEKDYAYHIYHLYVIRNKKRDELREFLKENEVETGVHYRIPLHLQPAMKDYASGSFPEAEKACSEIISMPIYPGLEEKDIDLISEKIKEFE